MARSSEDEQSVNFQDSYGETERPVTCWHGYFVWHNFTITHFVFLLGCHKRPSTGSIFFLCVSLLSNLSSVLPCVFQPGTILPAPLGVVSGAIICRYIEKYQEYWERHLAVQPWLIMTGFCVCVCVYVLAKIHYTLILFCIIILEVSVLIRLFGVPSSWTFPQDRCNLSSARQRGSTRQGINQLKKTLTGGWDMGTEFTVEAPGATPNSVCW